MRTEEEKSRQSGWGVLLNDQNLTHDKTKSEKTKEEVAAWHKGTSTTFKRENQGGGGLLVLPHLGLLCRAMVRKSQHCSAVRRGAPFLFPWLIYTPKATWRSHNLPCWGAGSK